jgi:hypothetical protein
MIIIYQKAGSTIINLENEYMILKRSKMINQ